MVCVELEGELKRRRLAAGGVENHNPEQRAVRSPARSRRVESEVKPDTPAVASVRLRVQQLAQRRDGERRVIYLPLSMVSSEWFVFIMWVCVCVCRWGCTGPALYVRPRDRESFQHFTARCLSHRWVFQRRPASWSVIFIPFPLTESDLETYRPYDMEIQAL